MKRYKVKAHDGFEYEVQLSNEEAKRLGLDGMHVEAVEVKEATPPNKGRKASTK